MGVRKTFEAFLVEPCINTKLSGDLSYILQSELLGQSCDRLKDIFIVS